MPESSSRKRILVASAEIPTAITLSSTSTHQGANMPPSTVHVEHASPDAPPLFATSKPHLDRGPESRVLSAAIHPFLARINYSTT